MARRVDILLTGRAVAILRQLDQPHREQFDRLINALRLSPQAGVFYAHDDDRRPLYQVSGADLHVIYTITYHIRLDRVFIVAIDLAEWTPHTADNLSV